MDGAVVLARNVGDQVDDFRRTARIAQCGANGACAPTHLSKVYGIPSNSRRRFWLSLYSSRTSL